MDQRTHALLAQARQSARGLPPVEQWQPKLCGDIDIRIDAAGHWFHEGRPFRRPALMRLLSTLLRKDGDVYYLVTPQEKLAITVEDAPFVIVDADILDVDGRPCISMLTQCGDQFLLDAQHPLWVCQLDNGEPRPYVHVRGRLDALVSRAVFYRLIEAAMETGQQRQNGLYLNSDNQRFLLGTVT